MCPKRKTSRKSNDLVRKGMSKNCMHRRIITCLRCSVFTLCLTMFTLPLVGQAATVKVVNLDGPNAGLNDPAPAPPVGGNTGTTLGAQRKKALQFAADI